MKPKEIERLLPEVFRASLVEPGPMTPLLEVMAQMHAPCEAALDALDDYFDPGRADDRFVPLLSRWVDLERLFVASAAGASGAIDREPISSGMGRLRELVARVAYLSQWRGTRLGLVTFLETAVGVHGFEIEDRVPDAAGVARPFHLRVVAPAGLQAHRLLIERIIELEKPAYATCELDFKPDET